MTRLLLIAVLWALPLHSARSQAEDNPFQTYGHTFDDLLDAVRTLRKKTIPEAYFLLHMPQYPAAPFFGPDAAGEAFFVLPVARVFTEAPPPKELAEELTRLRRASRYAPAYDDRRRRLALYPPEAVAELRRALAPWLLPSDQFPKHPILRFTNEFVAARIPHDRESEFLDALLVFLHTTRKEFKCSVGWN
jgi:hypothetical protein